jgi:hypothetical protein
VLLPDTPWVNAHSRAFRQTGLFEYFDSRCVFALGARRLRESGDVRTILSLVGFGCDADLKSCARTSRRLSTEPKRSRRPPTSK